MSEPRVRNIQAPMGDPAHRTNPPPDRDIIVVIRIQGDTLKNAVGHVSELIPDAEITSCFFEGIK